MLKTTGVVDPVTGRRKMCPADILSMKDALDKLGVPSGNRRLVLCSDHVNDLLGCSETFARQYNLDTHNGVVGRLFGFDMYENSSNPVFTSEGVKKAVGASADEGEFQCSFAFYTKRAFRAEGSTKMYYSEAKTDPQHQRNLINYRHYFILMPKKRDAMVAIMSDHDA